MKVHDSELISALADGELKGLRLWLVRRHVSQCAPCAAQYRHLIHVRQMLTANPTTPAMSDSPEFFWSKVKREIQAGEGQMAEVPVPALGLADWLRQHQPALASAIGALVVTVGLLLAWPARQRAPAGGETAIIPPPLVKVEHAATFIPDTVATSFDATDSEPAVIWVSGLPWTPDMTELKTRFALMGT